MAFQTGDYFMVLSFLALAKYSYFYSRYLNSLDAGGKREAIAQIQTQVF